MIVSRRAHGDAELRSEFLGEEFRTYGSVMRCIARAGSIVVGPCLVVLGLLLPTAATGAGAEASSTVEVICDSDKRAVVYSLGRPSRVTIRAGIDGGPLLKNVLVGEVRQAGEHVEPWDGMDESEVVSVVSQKGFLLQGEAVRIGNGEGAPAGPSPRPFPASERGGGGAAEAGAKLKLRIGEPADNSGGVLVVSGETPIQVSLDGPADPDAGKPVHELIFFLDFQFLQELEGESLPVALPWDTREVGDGEHIITVNVVAPGGEVSAASARIVVKNPEARGVRR